VLRTNLSTRPFYNERAVYAAVAALALVVLAATAWQITRVVSLSRYKTELNAAIDRDKAEAAVRARDAAQIRSGLDQKQLAVVAAGAKEANQLIEQRTFSWTQLFNLLEATLPEDVMLTSVRPDFKEGVTQVNLDVQGRHSDDIDAFWDRLEKTGAFRNIQWSAVTVTDEGLNRIQMRAVYSPPSAPTRPVSAVVPAAPAGSAAPRPGAAAAPAPARGGR
jgi:Tfp pilus assembly protein PilN